MHHQRLLVVQSGASAQRAFSSCPQALGPAALGPEQEGLRTSHCQLLAEPSALRDPVSASQDMGPL